jgi:CO/xanthine dehydrogenase Mo-binding subunit
LVGTQSQIIAQEATANLLGIARDKVKLNDMLMGGGVAPAISNAMAQLTGVRLRHTPFTPERVEEALG